MSQRIYYTQGGEMLDEIAFKCYGDETFVQALLEANPGLAQQPMRLPPRVKIYLPEAPQKPEPAPIDDIWSA